MALFLSDVHLGHRLCQAERLLKFLYAQSPQLLYLVGDILDCASSRRWPEAHREVLATLLGFPRIIYLPGNHDGFVRALLGWDKPILVRNAVIHCANDGRRYLVTHGDAYDPTLILCRGPQWFRRIFGGPVDGLHGKLISNRLPRRLVAEAAKQGCNGVICGHTHHPEQKLIDEIEYLNCGDWFRSCTAVIEQNGQMKLVAG